MVKKVTEYNLAMNLGKTEPERVKVPQKDNVKKKSGVNFSSFLLFSVVCVCLAAIVLNHATLTETTAEVSRLEKQLDQLKDEKILLDIHMDEKTNFKSVEELAEEELGMIKIQSYQIEYINISQDNKIEVLKEQNPNVISVLIAWTDWVLEYFD